MSGPFDGVVAKLAVGTNAVIQVCGDSTGQGLRTPSTQDPNYGWVGRLAINIGTGYDVNIDYHGASYPGSVTWSGYNQNTSLYTSSRGGAAPTLTIQNGSMGGAQATHLVSWINGAQNLIPDPNPDVVLVACGFNDAINGANVLSRIQSLVNTIRARCPTAPIVVTTENRSTGTYPTSSFLPSFSAVSNYYVGSPLNLSPALIGSSSVSNVWVLDTQQAYTHVPLTDWMTTNDSVGGLHPNSTGYQAQADWMYGIFPAPAPAIVTASLSGVVRGVPFSQVLQATPPGATWSVVSGLLPMGLSLNAATGELSGTPVAYGGGYDVTIRATNLSGHDDRRFTGLVDRNADPFNPTGLAKHWFHAMGNFYPVAMKIKASGAMHVLSPRD